MDRPGVRQVPEGSGEQGGKKRGNWLRNRLLCPSDPHGGGIDDDDDDDDDPVLVGRALFPYLGLLLAPWRLLGWPFSRACQDFLGEVRRIVPCLRFFPLIIKAESSSRTPIPLCRSGSVHIGSACLDDCVRVFPDELHASSFP